MQQKIFIVPVVTPDQEDIPFSRVNHNKYMVTDNAAYVGEFIIFVVYSSNWSLVSVCFLLILGTSNWSGDYFVNTGGVGFVINDTATEEGGETFRSQLKKVFDRDWNSEYATPL